jgi:cobalt-precorrin-5B (C1)-methyltransferase
MNLTKNINGKLLRCGYTTGTCAAAAAKAASVMLLTGEKTDKVNLFTPNGVELVLDVLDAVITPEYASCSVRKDAGDDPDVTDGIHIYAHIEKTSDITVVDGGEGVGRVTAEGLDRPVGSAAINSVPRKMIMSALRETAEKYGYKGGFSVIISVPNGAEIAKHTFNPRIGIKGGISIIGTTGIVEPMSHSAIAETIKIELKLLRQRGAKRVLFTPGNYGEKFVREILRLSTNEHISCSNCIGEAVDEAAALGFAEILTVGHIGKLVKLGIGITNTHSRFGDGRMETLTVCALGAGADVALLKKISECYSTDAAIELMRENGILSDAMSLLGERIYNTLRLRVPENVSVGFVCFANRGRSAEFLMQGGLDYGTFRRSRSRSS